MKNLFLLLFLTSLFLACTNNDEIIENAVDTAELNMYDKAYYENATLDEKLSYKRFHLTKIASWLLKNEMEVKEALTILNSNYNGEADTFFVETVINQITSNQDIDKIETGIDENLEFSLNAFVDIENESWYPTMRAHNFERYLNRNPYDSTKTLYALDDYDQVNQEQIMKGYQENSNGELEPIDETLNEQLAGEDDIIVLDLLPCAEGGGQQQLRGACDTGGGGSQYTFKLKIEKMIVKHYKEGWPGRSEINFKGYALSAPFGTGDCGNNIAGTSNCQNESGRRIDRYERNWIGDQDEILQYYLIKTQQDYINDEVVFYIIFEEDSFPAPVETHTFEMPNGDLRNVSYRSWQSPYDIQTLSMNPANTYNLPSPVYGNFSVDKNSIKYNLTYTAY